MHNIRRQLIDDYVIIDQHLQGLSDLDAWVILKHFLKKFFYSNLEKALSNLFIIQKNIEKKYFESPLWKPEHVGFVIKNI